MKKSESDAKSKSREAESSVPVPPVSASDAPISSHSSRALSIAPSNELSRFEKLKYYTDLYKFYAELPFKVVTFYSVVSLLALAVAAHVTKSLRVTGWLAVIIAAIEVFIGSCFFMVDRRYIERHKDEVESLMKELGLSFGPDFHVLRFILRICVIGLIALPALATFILIYFMLRG
jgi:hypothetical protein